MRDGGAERAVLGALRIGVDPLVIAGQRGERVDVLLGDNLVLAVPQMLADSRPDLVDPVENPPWPTSSED